MSAASTGPSIGHPFANEAAVKRIRHARRHIRFEPAACRLGPFDNFEVSE
jgi:hypothetical protein